MGYEAEHTLAMVEPIDTIGCTVRARLCVSGRACGQPGALHEMLFARSKLLAAVAVISLLLVSIAITAIALHEDDDNGATAMRASTVVPTTTTQVAPTQARLMFCRPVVLLPDQAIGLVPVGLRVAYEPGTCKPVSDAPLSVFNSDGSIGSAPWDSQLAAPYDTDRVVWVPLRYELGGGLVTLDGSYLADAHFDAAAVAPTVILRFNQEGALLWHRLAAGLRGLPVAIFLDGEPLRTADGKVFSLTVGFEVTDSVIVAGLSDADANHLIAVVTSSTPAPSGDAESPTGAAP